MTQNDTRIDCAPAPSPAPSRLKCSGHGGTAKREFASSWEVQHVDFFFFVSTAVVLSVEIGFGVLSVAIAVVDR